MKWLFMLGSITLRSGKRSWWKVECDALTEYDWDAIARWIYMYARPYSEVIGVATGGEKLAIELNKYKSARGPRLIVDDVLTTGETITALMTRPDDIGFVVFARGPLPERVRAMWVLGVKDMTV
jgi:hypothetical protein